MKHFLKGWPLFLLVFINIAKAQKKDSVLFYPIVVKFQSKCCGVPDQKPLDSAILLYKIRNHIRIIKADKISPMGREGEYYLAFKKSKFLSRYKKSFTALLEKVCKQMNEPGYIEIEKNATINTADIPSRAEIEAITF